MAINRRVCRCGDLGTVPLRLSGHTHIHLFIYNPGTISGPKSQEVGRRPSENIVLNLNLFFHCRMVSWKNQRLLDKHANFCPVEKKNQFR